MIQSLFAQASNNSAAGAFFGVGFLFIALALLYTCAWLYALFSAATRTDLGTTERLIWILVLILVPGIGTLLYFLLKGRGP